MIANPPDNFTCDLNVTSGDYADEAASCAELDRLLDLCGLFRVYKEVCGDYLHPRLDTPERSARVDRLLIPTSRLIDEGKWNYGAIAVECKKSGEKLGPPIAQAMDYTRCAFRMIGGIAVVPKWAFIWPLDKVAGNIESVMLQHRIGQVCKGRGGGLMFRAGATTLLYVSPNEGIFNVGNVTCGNKVGRR